YAQVNDAANRIARAFRESGVTRGDRVCLMMANCPEFIFIWMGLAKLGAVTVGINPEYRADGLRHLIGLSGARFICLHTQYASQLTQIVDALPTLERAIYLGEKGSTVTEGLARLRPVGFERFAAAEAPEILVDVGA